MSENLKSEDECHRDKSDENKDKGDIDDFIFKNEEIKLCSER